MAGAAASSSSFRDSRAYDIFLSFRGDDTRNSFVSHLYGALDRRGIYTFKDDEKFEKGRPISEIIAAIEESKISIVVLSQNFANSSWCLDELVRILECKDVKRQEVLPVFYNVDPSHVRKQKGSFGEAFAKLLVKTLESSSDDGNAQRVQQWRKALEDVSSISGYDTRNREEHALVEEIVEKVVDKLHEQTPCNTENLIGMGSRLENLDLILGIGSNDVRFVGIWGMGGIGKTTIARIAYQRHFKKFDGHYFLPNVRESYKRDNPAQLQSELLCGVLNDRNFKMDFSLGGRLVMKDRLGRKRVLIVLDDIDNSNQLEDLVGRHDWFGPGSIIIITTRNRQILVSHGVDTIYAAESLNRAEAIELFCRYAFKNKQCNEVYALLTEQMVKYSNGLPLALRVLGSFLCSKSVYVWGSELAKLHKKPNRDILDVLKASYDGLDDTQKDIFLDIACFFKGGVRDYVRDIMDSCEFSGESGIEVLIDRSLITISEDRIWMHDLLQNMGWEIVRQQSKHPSGRTRLWVYDDICRAIESSKDQEEVAGILINLAEIKDLKLKLSVEAISRMKNLRVLRIGYFLQNRGLNYFTKEITEYFYGLCGYIINSRETEEVSVTSCKESLPSKLVSLHWDMCNITSLPDNFHATNLTELSMRFSWIRQLWAGVKHLDKLKYVNLSYSRYLISIPDFSGAPNLESLILDHCVLLRELHSSVAFLKRLIVLKLNGCVGLVSLPNKLRLGSLQDLDLWGCSSFAVFPEISESMPRLEELDLSNSNVEELPSSIKYLSGLRKLNLESCKYLRKLPRTISMLKSLQVLILSHCLKLEKFPRIEDDMPKLRELSLRGTPIKYVSHSFYRLVGLEFLDLDFCKNLVCIPDAVFSLKSLKFLHMEGCVELYNQQARPSSHERKWNPPKYTEGRGQTQGSRTHGWVHHKSSQMIMDTEGRRQTQGRTHGWVHHESSQMIVDTENLIGMNSRLKNLDLLLNVGSDDVRFVGIWGRAGIGKTIIARVAYNRHYKKFDGHYFLPNVREPYRRDGPTQLEFLCSVMNGRKFKKDQFHCKRVLVVLDDVDPDLLEEFVEVHDLFCLGSRIIITTRDPQILVALAHGVDKMYEAELFQRAEAISLFCQYAFKNKHSDEAYAVLVERMVHYSTRLPLALRVLGSFLCSKSVEVWETELVKLQKVPNLDILDVLKVSYDGLDDTQKDIFLDIACFFKGEDRDYVRDIMDSCGFSAESGIEVLTDRCLITISENRIWMDDLLQEMGWEIVRQQSKQDPSGRTRLWLYDDICRAIIQSSKDKEEVEGISADLTEYEWRNLNVSIEAISKMKNLRVLRIGCFTGSDDGSRRSAICRAAEEVIVTSGEESLLSKLVYLHWDRCNIITSLTDKFYPTNLTKLSMRFGLITQLWAGMKHLDKLKYVDLSYCRYLISIPDLSGAANLESLILDGCTCLRELHYSVAFLKRLTVLRLNGCTGLVSLPNKLHLVSLQDLGLRQCSSLTVFPPEIAEPMPLLEELDLSNSVIRGLSASIANLTGLRKLRLESCFHLRKLPRSIFKLKNLENLSLDGCSNLNSFPEIEDDMPKLRELRLCRTAIKRLPDSFDRLVALELLDLSYCRGLTCIPVVILKLKSLKYIHYNHLGMPNRSGAAASSSNSIIARSGFISD